MRPIKFRAWDGMRMTLSGVYFDNSRGTVETAAEMPLMQYTGLKDKNGVEIYEGDIIKSPEMVERFDGGYDDGLYICNWDKEVAGFFCGGITSSQMWLIEDIECEVIGNIYENPELL